MDWPKAITAMAHKLARLVYFMLTRGQAYVEAGQQYDEERYRERVMQNPTRPPPLTRLATLAYCCACARASCDCLRVSASLRMLQNLTAKASPRASARRSFLRSTTRRRLVCACDICIAYA